MTKPHKQPRDRVCEHCARNDGFEGPRPPGSMLRLVGNQLAYYCSQRCSDALGWSLREIAAYRRL